MFKIEKLYLHDAKMCDHFSIPKRIVESNDVASAKEEDRVTYKKCSNIAVSTSIKILRGVTIVSPLINSSTDFLKITK